jgi:hypothetical protein
VIVSRFLFSRKIRSATTFDFCNTIGHNRANGTEAKNWMKRDSSARQQDQDKPDRGAAAAVIDPLPRVHHEAPLFNHLVGAADKRQWNSEAGCSCGSEVAYQFDSYAPS